MLRFLMGIAASGLVLVFTGCASHKAHVDYDTAADFSSYRTFAWADDDQNTLIRDDRDRYVSALNLRRITTAIENELAIKGFSQMESASNADFLISFTVGVRETVDTDRFRTYPTGRWVHHWPYYHTGIDVEIDFHKYTEGMLAVDIYDGETQLPVWHGVERKRITGSDTKDAAAAIRKAVALIFREFPPGVLRP